MKKRKYKRLGIVFLFPLTFILSQCFHKDKPADPRGETYAGPASCLKCHKNVYQDYLHNTHYLTSRTASLASIHGSFSPGSNTVAFNNGITVMMEKHKDGLYEVSYANGKIIEKERFDITIGSKRAETYLYWKGSQVYQLPISYYMSLHKWANSPDFSADSASFDRLITTRCFECHSSYIKKITNPADSTNETVMLDKSSMLLSIDCERCHGPGSQHVNFHTQNPGVKQPMYMVKVSSLSRERRMDLCSVCHSGNLTVMTKPTFDFKPGDTLANYQSGERYHRVQPLATMDVHGNQAALLEGSQCFINSKIECATCHTLHDQSIKSVKMYSLICTSCHSEAKHNFCKMAAQLGSVINNNCIDCHMPNKTSKSIMVNGPAKQTTFPFVARMHRIAIYPEETQKVMAWLKTTPRN
jgi:hypothetical protein